MFKATRDAALKRLNCFVPEAGRAYATQRNYDFGGVEHNKVSALSPWIRHRLLLEQEVVQAVLAQHAFAASEKYVQEVFWRTYFKGWLEQRPQVWQRYRQDVLRLADQLDHDNALLNRYENAISGRTGIDCFDAWANELMQTGYLHNHARMWFASIWIFTLELPWQLGADFFYRHLLDGDPASNTLSWRWVAGLHTKGKNYLAKADNIAQFTNGRFNPANLVEHAPALGEAFLDEIMPLSVTTKLNSDKPFGLLISEEDCCVEALALMSKPKAIVSLNTARERSPLSVAESVYDFTTSALSDACKRASEYFELDAETIEHDDSVEFSAALIDWAKEKKLNTVVTAYAPVGPAAEKLALIKNALAKNGIDFLQLARPYDATCWPHARKGFFALKKKIPNIISELGIASRSL